MRNQRRLHDEGDEGRRHLDSDPKANPDAKKFDKISYLDVLTKELNVMDAAAISLCKDNDMPLLVFNMTEPGNIARVLKGEGSATLVY